jgi:hypothetical protein
MDATDVRLSGSGGQTFKDPLVDQTIEKLTVQTMGPSFLEVRVVRQQLEDSVGLRDLVLRRQPQDRPKNSV